jgi:hypothetical protein
MKIKKSFLYNKYGGMYTGNIIYQEFFFVFFFQCRMPRRRKSVHSNKAPLIFTESPVNKQSNVPSPIYCARHPLTAKSVPVEDLHCGCESSAPFFVIYKAGCEAMPYW